MTSMLVTGAAGFIGSHLVEKLIEDGHHVTGIDNLSNGKIENLREVLNHKNFKFLIEDISDLNLNALDTNNFDIVYHLAGLADIVPSIENPKKYFKANVVGTQVLIDYFKDKSITKFVYAASASCYGMAKEFPTNENSRIDLQYPYALTKFQGEQLVLHYGKVYKMPTLSLRLFNVYGPRSRTNGTYGAVMGVFMKQKIANAPVTIVGDGEQKRDFVYISDVVEAFVKAGFSDKKDEAINIGSGNPKSVNFLADLISDNRIYIPKRPGEPDLSRADISKAKELLNWSPKVELAEGVEKMLQNLDYWKDAPLWDVETISEATSIWFKYLT
jgi:UDP-glucose 4-epimerase